MQSRLPAQALGLEWWSTSVPTPQLRRIDQADQRAVVDVVFVERAVQPPPELLQNLGKVLRRRARQRDAARQRAVEMRVAVDQRGHEQAAAQRRRLACAAQRRGRAAASPTPIAAVRADLDAAANPARGCASRRSGCGRCDDHGAECQRCPTRHDVRAGLALDGARQHARCEVMMHSSPPCSTKSIAASIFGPIEPAGNSPAARYARAWRR